MLYKRVVHSGSFYRIQQCFYNIFFNFFLRHNLRNEALIKPFIKITVHSSIVIHRAISMSRLSTHLWIIRISMNNLSTAFRKHYTSSRYMLIFVDALGFLDLSKIIYNRTYFQTPLVLECTRIVISYFLLQSLDHYFQL